MQQNGILQLSVIIINYNVKFFLEQCLLSLLKAAKEIACEILVVDNASTDGSKEYLTDKFPQVHFYWLSSNLGFGKANNYAFQKAKADYILLLNPDTIIAEDSLMLCLEYFKTNGNCGALGVRMIDGNGSFLKESKRGFPTLARSFFRFSGLCNVFPHSKKISGYYCGHLPQNKSGRVEVLSGAFLMLQKKTIEAINGFDENFFMYGDDIDLSYRIHNAGMENHYFAGTTIVHFKGESTQRFSKSYVKHFYNAMHIYVNKHYQQNKTSRAFMHVFITASQCLAGFKLSIKKFLSKREPIKNLNAAIVSTQPEFNQMLQLIKFALPPVTVCGRIANTRNDTGANIGSWKNINTVVAQKKITLIAFCEGSNTFKNIITQMQETKVKQGFLIYSAGSNSMVGSNNKNSNGRIITRF